MKQYTSIGLGIPKFLLPQKDVDLSRWAVIACDQFTSEPDYWEKVRLLVGDSPSTFHLTLPEVYLGKPEGEERLRTINSNMGRYIHEGLLQEYEGMVYIERTVAGQKRKGLLVCLDLEKYDYNQGSTSLIRATEGTILDRLPPRIKIRENASLELPHILVLIDDPGNIVMSAATRNIEELPLLYDFDLMLGSGHLSGWLINAEELVEEIADGLTHLAGLTTYRAKYNLPDAQDVLLYAMGDGNHSLATAKAIWEEHKEVLGLDHPSRYALVELENVHDEGLEFEPIHRVLFEVKADIIIEIETFFSGNAKLIPVSSLDEMKQMVAHSAAEKQYFGLLNSAGYWVIELDHPKLNLPVGNLQSFLDMLINSGGAVSIDYVHGEEAVKNLGMKPGNTGFYLPVMHKSELFKTVILDGALPRKTFSMGEAKAKRFYLEARKIK